MQMGHLVYKRFGVKAIFSICDNLWIHHLPYLKVLEKYILVLKVQHFLMLDGVFSDLHNTLQPSNIINRPGVAGAVL